jgi:UDP-galactopyranose mutase
MENVLIVGSGLTGCVLANKLLDKNIKYNILIIDKRDHIGGNCYDYYENGILMNKYGAHIFHTNNEMVWNYVNKYGEWIPWYHKVIGKIDNKTFPIPVNNDTVKILLSEEYKITKNTIENPSNSEETCINNVGDDLYKLIFKEYTYKQWAKYPNELDSSVLSRIPVREDNNPNYFNDKYQALPKNGYTKFIEKLIDHPNIVVKLNTEFDKDIHSGFNKIFFTGPIDHYYNHLQLPKLEYRSINFVKEYLDIDYFQENSVVNYPQHETNNEKTPWTRIIEYKHFYNQIVPNKTVIVKEITTDIGEPYYPIPTKRNQELYMEYQKQAIKDEVNNIYFLGRLGSYKYLNMDQAIEQALLFAEKF